MLNFVNQQDNVAVLRLLEFLIDRKPWSRSLWGIGVILAMDEFYEACTASKQGHLSEGAIRRMACLLQRRVGQHPAFSKDERRFLQQQIEAVPRPDGATHFAIRELSTRVAYDYLERWGKVVAAGRFNVEHFARSVAAHLLDAGFAAPHLHNFIKGLLDSPQENTLSQICDALQAEMRGCPRRDFEVLLAFSSIPSMVNGIPPSWLQGAAVTAWLRERGFATAGVRSPAAILLSVRARDNFGAAQAARAEAERYAARALIATGKPLRYLPILWVNGSTEPASMKADSRGVGVKELFREDRVFSSDVSQSVDAALELMSHLESSSPTAAVAGGWGAIEGLLADPSDRSSAADNLATLVACSFPRAELTALSYRLQKSHPEMCPQFDDGFSNRERCRILARLILDNRMPMLVNVTDQAAVTRMKKLLADPRGALQTIKDAIGESFHRLYRQRNLILHGGRLDSVTLTASLRTVAKLAGAGMDRITHGFYVQELKPLQLVAKANLALAVVGPDDPLGCVDLLEVT